jgi:glutathione synthase/RimK-type ligase-like ATP-grasp enzyme
MKNKILVITSSYDLTVDYVIKKFPALSFFRLNTDNMNLYDICISNDPFSWDIKIGKESIKLSQTEAIYYRKPSLPSLVNFSPEYHSMISKELFSFIDGLVESFNGRCLSKPSILRRADNKILQLKLAEKVGFSLPKSCITNSSSKARFFLKNHTKLYIIKPLFVGKVTYKDGIGIIQTNLVDRSKKMNELCMAPSYFQEYCSKDYELRVTVIGQHFYSVRIDACNKIDWRKSPDKINYSVHKLPVSVKKKCLYFLDMLALNFGAFDFIVKDGKYYFLEVNANGQWGWLEEKLNLPISKSIINFLLGRNYV